MLRIILLIFTINVFGLLAACARPAAPNKLERNWDLPEGEYQSQHPLEGVWWTRNSGVGVQVIQTLPTKFVLNLNFGIGTFASIEVLNEQKLVFNDGTPAPYQRFELTRMESVAMSTRQTNVDTNCLVGVQTVKTEGVVTLFDVRWCRRAE